MRGRRAAAAAAGQGPDRSPSRHQPPPPAMPRASAVSLSLRPASEGRMSPSAAPRPAHLTRKEPPWRAALEKEPHGAAQSQPPPPSRFLKQKAAGGATEGSQQVGPSLPPQRGLGAAASKGRPSPILRRVAQIERKIQSRRSQQEEAVQLAAFLDAAELSVSEVSGHSAAQRAGGHPKYTKAAAGLEGDGKARASQRTEGPLGDTAEATEGPGLGRKGLPGRSPLKRTPRAPASPSSLKASPGPPGRGAAHPSSPSLQGSLSADPAAQSPSPYEGSIIRSLDELFSQADDTAHSGHDRVSSSSASSDFRVNILSLDDLVPEGGSQEVEEAKGGEGTPLQAAGKRRRAPAAAQSVFSAQKAASRKGSTSEEEEEEAEELAGMEISERLGGPSAALTPSSGTDETPRGADYSEDFEPSSSSSLSSSFAASEEGAGRFPAPSEESHSRPEASLRSRQSPPSSLKPPCGSPGSTRPSGRQRAAVKEAAVQTSHALRLPQWLQTDVPIIGLAIGEGSCVDALPVGSPTLSPDAIEALTTYAPATFALNEVLKSHLLLIRQFAEANRRLHASVVASLEEEVFHYHTLEEAKRYISSHKAPPLTMEQALREMEEQEEAAL